MFYAIVVAPIAAYLLARMVTFAILMSTKRFREKYPNNSNQERGE